MTPNRLLKLDRFVQSLNVLVERSFPFLDIIKNHCSLPTRCRNSSKQQHSHKPAHAAGGASCARQWGRKRETGEVKVGADNHERRARKPTGWKAHIESKTQGADLPSSWRSASTKTHSLPRTLVFRGFTSHQLGSSGLTLGPPVDTAFMASHGHQRTATSGR